MNAHRLYRSRNERMIAGVAGGMAEYLDVDPTVIRILWILATFLGGITILLYPIMVLIVPNAPYGAPGAGWVPGPGWVPAAPPAGTPGTGEGTTETATSSDGSPIADGTAAPTGWIYQPAVRSERHGPGASAYVGVLLILAGLFALGDNVFPGWFLHASAGPVIVVAFGAMLLFSALRRPAAER